MVSIISCQTEQGVNTIQEVVQRDGILPTPLVEGHWISLESKEADDQGQILLDKTNLRLVDSMGRDVNLDFYVFSRKKNCLLRVGEFKI